MIMIILISVVAAILFIAVPVRILHGITALKWAVRNRTVIPAGMLSLALLLTGCKGLTSYERDGKYFPYTVDVFEQCVSQNSYGYEDCLQGILCACSPFALATDIVLFPYDTYLRTKGFNILVQDESGEPISGAEVCVTLHGFWYCYEGKTNSRGIRYVPRSRDCWGQDKFEKVSVFCVAKNFESLQDDRPCGTFAQDMKTNTWTIIMHREEKEKQ